ncbi:stage V sporulation protein K [Bacillaceae bacterium]
MKVLNSRLITKTPHRIQVVLEKNPRREEIKLAESFRTLQQHDDGYNPEHERMSRVVKELDRLVGLKEVKELIYEIYALLFINKCRSRIGLKTDQQVLHMIFRGNPGTGKTTVARVIGKLFREMGVLEKGHLVEVERADLVGEYIGHTAVKTREHVKKALGGILFIDEAYSLARGGEKDFGKEAIDTLVKAMEDHKHEFVLILAGYSYEMDRFLQSNPGLPSRFPIQIEFPDFTIDQLLEIADLMLKEREYKMSTQYRLKLKNLLLKEMNDPFRTFSNARYVRNIIEKSIRNQAVRLIRHPHPTREELMLIRPEDLQLE